MKFHTKFCFSKRLLSNFDSCPTFRILNNFALWTTDNGFDLENERTSEDSTAITESQNAIESNSVSTSGLQNKVVVYGAEIVNGNVASSCHQVEHTVPETYSSRFAFFMFLDSKYSAFLFFWMLIYFIFRGSWCYPSSNCLWWIFLSVFLSVTKLWHWVLALITLF